MYKVYEFKKGTEAGYQSWFFDTETKAKDKMAERLAIRDGSWEVDYDFEPNDHDRKIIDAAKHDIWENSDKYEAQCEDTEAAYIIERLAISRSRRFD